MSDASNHIRKPTEASGGRQAFHATIALAGWALFVYWWTVVVRRVSAHEVRFTLGFIAVSVVVCVVATGLWVFHNQAIFRRKGERTQVREAVLDYSRDPLGRVVTFETPREVVIAAPVVRIHVDSNRKTYRSLRPTSSVGPTSPR